MIFEVRVFDLALELLAIVLDFHININSRFENASRSCAALKLLFRCSGTQSLSNEQEMEHGSKKQKVEQVAVVGQREGGGMRVASILGRT